MNIVVLLKIFSFYRYPQDLFTFVDKFSIFPRHSNALYLSLPFFHILFVIVSPLTKCFLTIHKH